jgi:hypothetical protein
MTRNFVPYGRVLAKSVVECAIKRERGWGSIVVTTFAILQYVRALLDNKCAVQVHSHKYLSPSCTNHE